MEPPLLPRAEYRMVTEHGWDSVLPLVADTDDGAIRLGRRLAHDPDNPPAQHGLRTSHRVERRDGSAWRVLHAWVPRA
jgi:hypothetical protein